MTSHSKEVKNVQLSVAEYADQAGVTRQYILKRIKKNNFKKGITFSRVGSYWVISVPGDFKRNDLLEIKQVKKLRKK